MTPDDTEYFYFENGLMIFTEKYHLRRGYCCQSGCRHCPYGFRKETSDARLQTKDKSRMNANNSEDREGDQ